MNSEEKLRSIAAVVAERRALIERPVCIQFYLCGGGAFALDLGQREALFEGISARAQASILTDMNRLFICTGERRAVGELERVLGRPLNPLSVRLLGRGR
jgi:hypothetical protein